MKTYIPTRANLFIGLLSLHTLSSCANTGQTLGIRNSQSKKIDDIDRYEDTRKKMGLDTRRNEVPANGNCLSKWKNYCLGAGVGAGLTGLTGLIVYGLSRSNPTEIAAANTTTALATGSTTTPFIRKDFTTPMSNINNETITNIMHAIYPEEEGFFYGNVHLFNTTKGIVRILKTPEEAVDKGIDLNQQDHAGNTVLHRILDIYGASRNSDYLDKFNYLVDKGAELCIKNEDNKTARVKARELGVLKKLNPSEKCAKS